MGDRDAARKSRDHVKVSTEGEAVSTSSPDANVATGEGSEQRLTPPYATGDVNKCQN